MEIGGAKHIGKVCCVRNKIKMSIIRLCLVSESIEKIKKYKKKNDFFMFCFVINFF